MQRMLASIILKQKKFGNTNSLCKNRSKEVIIDRGPQSNRYPRIQSSLFWSIVNNVRIEGENGAAVTDRACWETHTGKQILTRRSKIICPEEPKREISTHNS